MAEAVYKDNPRVEGWNRIGFRPTGSGITNQFQGAAFSKGSEAVFVFKGTDPSLAGDLVADLRIGMGANIDYYNHAQAFVERTGIGSCSLVTICGHSLGGAIAQIIGNRLRKRFITFNAPGVAIVSRNIDQMAVATVLGTGAFRTIGAIGSAFLHPFQAAQDVGGLFYRVSGVNMRLGADVVGNIGVHYGQVIQIPYHGDATDVMRRHSISTFVSELEDSAMGGRSLVDILN